MMLKNLGLTGLLGTGFTVVVAVFLSTLLVVAGLLSRLEQGVQQVAERSLPLILAVDQMDLSRSEVQQFLTDVSATRDPAAYEEARAAADQFHVAAQSVRLVLEQEGDTARLNALKVVVEAFDALYLSGKTMAQAYVNEGLEAGNRLMKGSDGKPGFDQASEDVSQHLTAFREEQLQRTRQDAADGLHAAGSIQRAMLWGAAIATLLALACATLTVRIILKQIGGEPRRAVQLVRQVGAGDLSTPIVLEADDHNSLMAHLQAMQRELSAVVSTVREKSRVVQRASEAMESGNRDLAARTASQASSLEETAAAMEEFGATVRQNLDGARRADTMAASARTAAEQGGELVGRFVDTMEGISEASRKIADIIGVIDGIAFQTNILALNAAVEAARAGEQGRGFAVVASEVRSLAGRSAEAAKAVKTLIGTSVDRVEQGSALVSQASATMAQVVQGTRDVSAALGEITSASFEQSSGVAQIAQAVTRMDQTTQQNAALVEESASAAASLREQAHALAQAMAVFNLAADGSGAEVPQSAPGALQRHLTPALA